MMSGIEVETTVPEMTATNIATTRPEMAMITSRGVRCAGTAGTAPVAGLSATEVTVFPYELRALQS